MDNQEIEYPPWILLKTNLTFLGYGIDANGIHPSENLTKAIVEAPNPSDVTMLRAFLGLINFYGKFLPNLSSVLHPLYELLQEGRPWHWSAECQKAFVRCKQMLVESKALVPYDISLPIVVTADASSYGLGAVMSHVMPDKSIRPVMFASRSLNKAERNYAQLDKEALALVFAVKRFHKYLLARNFTLVTDHRPLLALFGERRSVPVLAAARMQRWAVILSAYDYSIVYKKGSEIIEADTLSRLPLQEHNDDMIQFFAPFPDIPITSKEIRAQTHKDPALTHQ